MKMLFAAICLLILLSCGRKTRVPEGILPPKEMQSVMWDLMRAGEFLNGYVLYKDSNINKTAENLRWYNKVWSMHHITEAQFNQSYAYYRANPKLMEEVLDSISKLPPPALKTKQPMDSIHRLKDSIGRLNSLAKRQLIMKGDSLFQSHQLLNPRRLRTPDSLHGKPLP